MKFRTYNLTVGIYFLLHDIFKFSNTVAGLYFNSVPCAWMEKRIAAASYWSVTELMKVLYKLNKKVITSETNARSSHHTWKSGNPK